MKQVLAEGMHMCIYPEGTRNRTHEPMKKFHDGAFRLAQATGHSIIPAVIFNTKKALPVNKSFFFRPSKLRLHFLEEIKVQNKTAQELKEEVFRIMNDYYVSNSASL